MNLGGSACGSLDRLGRSRRGSVSIRIGLCDKIREGCFRRGRFGHSGRSQVSFSSDSIGSRGTAVFDIRCSRRCVHRQIGFFLASLPLLTDIRCIPIIVYHRCRINSILLATTSTTRGRTVLLRLVLNIALVLLVVIPDFALTNFSRRLHVVRGNFQRRLSSSWNVLCC